MVALQTRLHELFLYREGKLIRKVSRGNSKIGSVVGKEDTSGYIRCNVDKKHYLLHRLIWVYHYGDIPKSLQIDHIDRNKLNNNILNLRLVTNQENSYNTKSKGVYKRYYGAYQAKIQANGTSINLGHFKTEGEALEAYKKGKEVYHRSFNRRR